MLSNLYNDAKWVAGQASPEDALTAANYPASASYVDVSGYELVEVIVHLGAVHASDTPTFQLKCAEAANGTLDAITGLAAVAMAGDDDDQFVYLACATENLPVDHHFVSTVVSGVANGSYGDIMYFLSNPRHKPVTQAATITAGTLF